jgi:hypothetical protein
MPEDRILHNLRCENLKSYNIMSPNAGKMLDRSEISWMKCKLQDFGGVTEMKRILITFAVLKSD